jgi:hypothetical protein
MIRPLAKAHVGQACSLTVFENAGLGGLQTRLRILMQVVDYYSEVNKND